MTVPQVFNLLAFPAAAALYLLLRRRFPMLTPRLSARQIAGLLLGAILGGLAGARLLAMTESLSAGQNPFDPKILLAGKSLIGTIFGGWGGVQIAKLLLRISYPSADGFVFPAILGIAVARIGGSFADPAQLYEVLFLAALAGFFLWRIRTRRQKGCMFTQFVIACLAFRFAVEFFKPRFSVPFLYISPVQLACLAGLIPAWFRRNDQCCGLPISPNSPIAPCGPTPRTLEITNSLCPLCLQKVEAKILHEGNAIFLQKFCPSHGIQRVLIADDAAYWLRSRQLYKPPTAPLRRNTAMRRGCPFDCGLCPDHEQHSCLAIVEITDQCDLACPLCYAASNPAGQHRSLAQIETMLDAVVANEGQVNVVQISGGEPTLHPDFFAILDAARKRPIRHLMVNTNGRRIAEDPAFAARLADYLPGLEIYLQFDSLRPESLRRLRGQDLSDIRRRALDALNRHKISTTLVVTLAKGVNDEQIGEIIDFALAQPCIRGITFQPVQSAGRLPRDIVPADRLTLTAVRSAILRQHKLFAPQDLVPVPCHTDALAMAYAIRRKSGGAIPLSKILDPQSLLNLGGNTICYEQDPAIREHAHQLFSAGASPTSAAATLNALCCLPAINGDKSKPPIAYDQIFRIIIMQFMDAHSLDLRSVKRACVHIVHPDGRLIPFDTYNILYRNARSVVASTVKAT